MGPKLTAAELRDLRVIAADVEQMIEQHDPVTPSGTMFKSGVLALIHGCRALMCEVGSARALDAAKHIIHSPGKTGGE